MEQLPFGKREQNFARFFQKRQQVCVVQGSEHVAVNNKVAGSNPAANVFKNLKTT